MNLAQELNLMANETDRAVRDICTDISQRARECAQYGGFNIEYSYKDSASKELKTHVFNWLTSQGFSVDTDYPKVYISWEVLYYPALITLSDRVRERITAATRYEKDSVTLSTATFSPEEVEAAVEELLHDGFTVDVDNVFNEISVSWE